MNNCQGKSAFQVVDFQPFLNEQATSENINRALRNQWGMQSLGKGDVLFFYFAGHGVVLEKEERAFLCCYDTNFRNPDSGGLRLDDLYGKMQRKVTAETVIVILDACYSGSIVDPGIVNYNPTQQLQAALSQMLPQTISHRMILSAAHADQKAREKQFPDGGSGVFTHALLEGWRDGKAKTTRGLVTPHSLAEYVQQEFEANRRQRPMTVIAGGDVLVLGRFEPPVTSGPLPPSGPVNTMPPVQLGPHSTTFDPEKGRKLPVQTKPAPSARQELTVLSGAVGIAIAFLAVCALLVAFSSFFFELGFGVACLCALASIGAAGRFWPGVGILSLIQTVLLVGVAHNRFGLAAGFRPLDFIDQFAWLAILIFFIQACIILYWVIVFARQHL